MMSPLEAWPWCRFIHSMSYWGSLVPERKFCREQLLITGEYCSLNFIIFYPSLVPSLTKEVGPKKILKPLDGYDSQRTFLRRRGLQWQPPYLPFIHNIFFQWKWNHYARERCLAFANSINNNRSKNIPHELRAKFSSIFLSSFYCRGSLTVHIRLVTFMLDWLASNVIYKIAHAFHPIAYISWTLNRTLCLWGNRSHLRSYLTTFGCSKVSRCLSTATSRMVESGIPSSPVCTLTRFRATKRPPFFRSRALYTLPYAPSPISATHSYCWSACWSFSIISTLEMKREEAGVGFPPPGGPSMSRGAGFLSLWWLTGPGGPEERRSRELPGGELRDAAHRGHRSEGLHHLQGKGNQTLLLHTIT